MSIYKSYSSEQLQELFSNFLIDSWSYSKVNSFARNEKAFEMQYIFGLYSRKSASTVAGNAYHTAIEYYFSKKREGITLDLVELEKSAFSYIDNIEANKWKIQKTTPTVEACIKTATTITTALLKNFVTEKLTYEEDIEEVLDIELSLSEFLTVNGVDIPLPCNAILDLTVRTKSGGIAIVDHKSKKSFTPDEEMAMIVGRQAITYVLSYEAKFNQRVDEVWFIENKYSSNKDGSSQLNRHTVTIDSNNRRLYEALLYEPLRRMLEAVHDPDYVYLINDSDSFIDRTELYDFWCRTMICEVEDFNVLETKKNLVSKRLKKIRDSTTAMVAPSIIKQFKANAEKFIAYDLSNKEMTHQEKIEHVLRSFKVLAKCAFTFEGYSSDTYLLEVSAGVKISSIHQYKLDIANALNVSTVRISKEMVVYENRSYLSIEVSKRRTRDLIFDPEALVNFQIPLGKDNFNQVVFWNLDNHSTPHSLICGATGSGKSVCVRTIIEYAMLAGYKEVIILDPKYEFKSYRNSGCSVINDLEEIELEMERLVALMQKRIQTDEYCRTLIIFDEFADAVANSKSGKELEKNLRILLQKGRFIGIRIVAATQRASTKVITGDAKVNFPVQICFRVPRIIDSQVVLDESGAESLSGYGDGLIKSPEYNDVIRFQAYFKPQQ